MGNLKSKLFFSLSSMTAEVIKILQLFSTHDLVWKPESWDGIPGERFSAIEQICHLNDIERNEYHLHIQAILNENYPILKSIDYKLSIQKDYQNVKLSEVIYDFYNARKKTLVMIEEIDESKWNRIAYFEGYGNITLKSLIHILCSHDFEHLSSLRWLLGKIETEKLNKENINN
ncbi:DinB family protein [Flavobacterium sp. ZT3R25]|uniref:DinB family protein n=1 Tax=Flavobacterium galactosi TaxID=3398735 RepID=UPI003A859BE2